MQQNKIKDTHEAHMYWRMKIDEDKINLTQRVEWFKIVLLLKILINL